MTTMNAEQTFCSKVGRSGSDETLALADWVTLTTFLRNYGKLFGYFNSLF